MLFVIYGIFNYWNSWAARFYELACISKADIRDVNFILVLLALRTWAIYQANFFILTFLYFLAFGSFVLNILSLLDMIKLTENWGKFFS